MSNVTKFGNTRGLGLLGGYVYIHQSPSDLKVGQE